MEQHEKCKKCNIKCGLIKVSPDVLRALEDGFQKLSESDSNSLLKKYLTRQIFDELKNKKTSFGSSLLDCIQSGFANHDSKVGIYAPDPEAYIVFSSIFDPIIQDYHMGFSPQDKHPRIDWGDLNNLENLDPNGEYIISTRVRCGRSIEGFPLNPCMSESHYREIEVKMKQIFLNFTGDLEGEYKSLVDMTKEEQNQLMNDHLLFRKGDRFLQSAKSCRYWPLGRGIFLNHNKNFSIWVNGKDHLRIISIQQGGNLPSIYKRMIDGVHVLEQQLTFSTSSRLGFLTLCPSNLANLPGLIYDNKIENEKHFLFNGNFQIDISCDLGTSILHIDCGISPARNFTTGVKLTCGEAVISFDIYQWKAFILKLQNENVNNNESDIEIVKLSENSTTSISKLGHFLFFSNDIIKIIQMNGIISNRIEMIENLQFPYYYYNFLDIIREAFVRGNSKSIEELINDFCKIGPSVKSYTVLECLFYYKNRILNDLEM